MHQFNISCTGILVNTVNSMSSDVMNLNKNIHIFDLSAIVDFKLSPSNEKRLTLSTRNAILMIFINLVLVG